MSAALRRRLLRVFALVAILGALPSLFAQPSANCADPGIGNLLDRAASLMRQGDDGSAAAALSSAGPFRCADVSLVQLALAGWTEARALAPKGGDKALLESVNAVLRALDALRRRVADEAGAGRRVLGLQIDYADAAIRAAVDAAQDERGEMAVYLDHAHDLSAVLGAAGDPPMWPLSFDELEGELWFEVDRYAEARAAFHRATSRGETARSMLFLARIAAREADAETACASYRRVLALGPGDAVRKEAQAFVAGCR